MVAEKISLVMARGSATDAETSAIFSLLLSNDRSTLDGFDLICCVKLVVWFCNEKLKRCDLPKLLLFSLPWLYHEIALSVETYKVFI